MPPVYPNVGSFFIRKFAFCLLNFICKVFARSFYLIQRHPKRVGQGWEFTRGMTCTWPCPSPSPRSQNPSPNPNLIGLELESSATCTRVYSVYMQILMQMCMLCIMWILCYRDLSISLNFSPQERDKGRWREVKFSIFFFLAFDIGIQLN